MRNGAVVYRGPSLLTGDEVFVALTGLVLPSANEKTGPMVQAWILRQDQLPTEAVKTGGDDAICGDCRHRSGSNLGRSCYVIWWLGPQNVWKTYHTDPVAPAVRFLSSLSDKSIRFGAYGDPAAVPAWVWLDLAAVCKGWVGYTHHWRTCDPILRTVLMASVDSVEEYHAAQASGWRTFRVRGFSEKCFEEEVVCPASAEAGHRGTCESCRLCGGLARPAKSVAIFPHGQRIKWLRT